MHPLLHNSPGTISKKRKLNSDELKNLNAKLLHDLPYEDVEDRLGDSRQGGEAFWLAVRGNLELLSDAEDWWQIANGTIEPVIENEAVTQAAAGLLPDEPWDESTWGSLTKAVKEKTGAKGRALFHPLRLALTGKDAGPELKVLLPFIGRERALERLTGS